MSGNDRLNDYLIPLIALLAQTNGQHGIATILNERDLPNPTNGRSWNQTSISRYMQQHGLKPMFTLSINPYEKTINY